MRCNAKAARTIPKCLGQHFTVMLIPWVVYCDDSECIICYNIKIFHQVVEALSNVKNSEVSLVIQGPVVNLQREGYIKVKLSSGCSPQWWQRSWLALYANLKIPVLTNDDSSKILKRWSVLHPAKVSGRRRKGKKEKEMDSCQKVQLLDKWFNLVYVHFIFPLIDIINPIPYPNKSPIQYILVKDIYTIGTWPVHHSVMYCKRSFGGRQREKSMRGATTERYSGEKSPRFICPLHVNFSRNSLLFERLKYTNQSVTYLAFFVNLIMQGLLREAHPDHTLFSGSQFS